MISNITTSHPNFSIQLKYTKSENFFVGQTIRENKARNCIEKRFTHKLEFCVTQREFM